MEQSVIHSQHTQQSVSIKVDKGYRVLLPASYPTGRGREAGYWKYAVPIDLHEWLLVNVGKTVGQHLWQLEDQGDWLFTGTMSRPTLPPKRGNAVLTHTFWFRDRKKALWFKLAWEDQL